MMSLDGFFFTNLIHELSNTLAGSRVDNIYRQDGNLVLQFRAPGRTHRLTIATHQPPYGLFLSQTGGQGKTRHPFAQTLKNHLVGLFCMDVYNPPFDRMATFSFAPAPDQGEEFFLHVEIMGRQNDVTLCHGDTIMASTRLPKPGSSRPLQPGDRFTPPPEAGKLSPGDISPDLLQTVFANIGELPAEKALVKSVLGVSPLLAKELCHRVSLGTFEASKVDIGVLTQLSQEINCMAAQCQEGKSTPVLYKNGPYWQQLRHLPPPLAIFPSLSQALAHWHQEFQNKHGFSTLHTKLQAGVDAGSRRLQRTLTKQQKELARAKDYQFFRQIGDTLLAMGHSLPKGASTAVLANVHTGEEIEIKLDPEKSLSANASHYYKRYNKYKNAVAKVKAQIKANHQQLAYLKSLDYSLESAATLADLKEIESEMQDQGMLRKPGPTKAKGKSRPGENFLTYSTPQGDQVWVGKNNRQNEILTLRKADKSHYWFHARHFPGSHVVLGNADPDKAALEFAAALAAWHCKARSSPKVEVVWTQVKNVKKIPGAKPGMVQYTDYRSALIEPQAPAEST